MKLNFGCGETKLPDFINLDVEEKTKPDIVCDIKTHRLPFEDETFEQINCIHNLEHIELAHWDKVFIEFRRILKVGGTLYLAYPEFEIVAKHFIDNFRGIRDFWRKTLYGRQLYSGDYHVVPMVTEEVIFWLEKYGFEKIRHAPEPTDPYNTFLECKKGNLVETKEDILRKEIFNLA